MKRKMTTEFIKKLCQSHKVFLPLQLLYTCDLTGFYTKITYCGVEVLI